MSGAPQPGRPGAAIAPAHASRADSSAANATARQGAVVGHSLRTRLLLLLFGAVALFATIQGVGAYRSSIAQADAMFDHHLRQVAHAMPRGVAGLPPGVVDDADDFDLQVQIWGPDGVQIFRSPRSLLPQSGVLGFSDVVVQGRAFRVYTVQTPLQTVQIAQDMSERDARARALAAHAVLPVVLMAPLLMIVVWWVVTRSLEPVDRARRQVAERAADDLSPLAVPGLPDEVRPLVGEINALFERLRTAFETQRHFVADAAHELRSPLAALKLQAQALRAQTQGSQGSGTLPADPAREAAVARLNQGIDRAIRVVEQLLALARADGSGEQNEPVDLREVVRLAVSDALPLAQARGIDLGLADDEGKAPQPAIVTGNAEALRMMLRNLIDNAVKYSPERGRVDVSLSPGDASQGACITVEDSGPGIAPDERERVFDRFYRSADAGQHTSGSGLGLAIVRTVADRHGARLQLDASPGLGGLRVQVRFARGAG